MGIFREMRTDDSHGRRDDSDTRGGDRREGRGRARGDSSNFVPTL